VAVITIAFCWAYHVGAWLNEIKAIRIKKHQRPAKSVFRYGFDFERGDNETREALDACEMPTKVKFEHMGSMVVWSTV
ncbi:hypothetical protein C2W62_54255, partial [Candidatus Entotheonella serta]